MSGHDATIHNEVEREHAGAHLIDTVDIRILAALQRNGRLSNVELSEQVGLSPPPALRRTSSLEERGLIRGYRVDIDQRKFGFHVTAFLSVELSSLSSRDIASFEDTMRLQKNVRECHWLSGYKDFLIRAIFRNLTEANDFIRNVLLTAEGVRRVNTMFSISRTKYEPGIPVETVEARLSYVDITRLRRLA
jgi:DNA-binding Lrp family transcriptional regulator